MTPKEKAIELTNKYKNSLFLFDDDIDSKKCAFIAVDEILSFIEDDRDGFNWKNYYKEVKQEIKKL